MTASWLIRSAVGICAILSLPASADQPVQPNVPMQVIGASHSWHDYDGDGDQDLLLSGNPGGEPWAEATYFENPLRIVLYDNELGTLTPSGIRFRGGWAWDEDNGEHVEGSGLGLMYAHVEWADFDGDGDDDLLLFGRAESVFGETPLTVVVYRNDGVEFGVIGVTNFPYYGTDSPGYGPEFEVDPATWGDVDGDGIYEIAYGREIAFFDGSGFKFDGTGLSGAPEGWIQLRDVDGDGDVDAILEVDSIATIYRNGDFVFVPTGIEVATGRKSWADWDQDGDPDFLAEESGTFWRNDGSGFSLLDSIPGPVWSSHWDDFDGDGVLDLIASGGSYSAQFCKLYFGGTHGFDESGVVLHATRYTHASFGQLDRDGLPDILLYGPYGPAIYHNDGNRGVTSVSVAASVVNSPIHWIDYDGDGDLDASVAGNRLFRNEDGVLTEIKCGLEDGATGDALWRDFDNDNDLDVVVMPTLNNGGGTVQLFWNDGATFRPMKPPLTESVSAASAAAADWNNDGWIDLLVGGRALLNRHGQLEFVETGPWVKGVLQPDSWADYDLDGDMDLLSGSYVWIPGFSTPFIFGAVQRNDGIEGWTAIGPESIGQPYGWVDFNQDGRPDIWTGAEEIKLYENLSGVFGEPVAGLPSPVGEFERFPAWGMVWSDHEGDGDLDAVVYGGIMPFTGVMERIGYDARLFSWTQLADGSFESTARSGRQGIGALDKDEIGGDVSGWGYGEAADADGDGDRDVYISGHTPLGRREWNTWTTENERLSPNSLPTAPPDLRVEVVDNRVTFSWSEASDVETPNMALTYNLRVGTTSDGGELMSAMADPATGRRWLEAPGNSGSRLSWTLTLDAQYLYWAVQAIDGDFAGGPFTLYDDRIVKVSGDHEPARAPLRTGLVSVAPNPFNPRTTVTFSVAETQHVDVALFDLRGRKVASLYSGTLDPGTTSRVWDGTSADGTTVAAGVYFVRFISESRIESRKLLLLK